MMTPRRLVAAGAVAGATVLGTAGWAAAQDQSSTSDDTEATTETTEPTESTEAPAPPDARSSGEQGPERRGPEGNCPDGAHAPDAPSEDPSEGSSGAT